MGLLGQIAGNGTYVRRCVVLAALWMTGAMACGRIGYDGIDSEVLVDGASSNGTDAPSSERDTATATPDGDSLGDATGAHDVAIDGTPAGGSGDGTVSDDSGFDASTPD